MERPKHAEMVTSTPPPPKRKKAQKTESTILADQKQLFEINPNALVRDNSYPRDTKEQSLKSVKAAAYQVNSGERRAFPADTYYAIWGETQEDENVYELLIGLRSHMKEEWKAIVERAGSRRKKATEETVVEGDPFVTEDDIEDDE